MEQEFTVATALDTAWAALLDVERVAPCLPGAEVTGRTGERSFDATMKVSLGPMRMRYAGQLTIAEADEEQHRAVLVAKGAEARGQGAANAQITMALAPEEDQTRVTVSTQLELAGRVAQMGSGIVERVADGMLDQFAACLSKTLAAPAAGEPVALGDHPAGAAVRAAGSPRASGVRRLWHRVLHWLRRKRDDAPPPAQSK